MVEESEDLHCDLLVVGGGMAGLTAGAWGAQRGLNVILLEKSQDVGGSAAMSGAHVWTTPTLEELRVQSPGGSPTGARSLIDGFPTLVEWIADLGVDMTPELTVLGYGRGHRIDMGRYLQRCRSVIESSGGFVMTSAETTALVTTAGRVTGARVVHQGEHTTVSATSTLLASGGFQGDPDLVLQHLGVGPDAVLRRANRHSVGDGLRLGLAAGAALSEHMHAFYGHLITWPLPKFEEAEFIGTSTFYSNQGLLFDLQGSRFVDESDQDHVNAQAVARVVDGRALLVLDAPAYQSATQTPAADGMRHPDPLLAGIEAGAHGCVADDLESLARSATAWGFAGTALLAEIERYNAGCDAGPEGTSPPRVRYRTPLRDAPFYAIEVKAGVTMTHGGLAHEETRVLDTDGVVIPGLYAAGADAGGLFDGGYAGGLAAAGVFGIRAAEHAVQASARG